MRRKRHNNIETIYYENPQTGGVLTFSSNCVSLGYHRMLTGRGFIKRFW